MEPNPETEKSAPRSDDLDGQLVLAWQTESRRKIEQAIKEANEAIDSVDLKTELLARTKKGYPSLAVYTNTELLNVPFDVHATMAKALQAKLDELGLVSFEPLMANGVLAVCVKTSIMYTTLKTPTYTRDIIGPHYKRIKYWLREFKYSPNGPKMLQAQARFEAASRAGEPSIRVKLPDPNLFRMPDLDTMCASGCDSGVLTSEPRVVVGPPTNLFGVPRFL